MSGPSKGQGGLDTVVIRHESGATCEIYLLGATLCSYKTPDGNEQIFVSPGAIYDGKKAIRGGVPLVFPQFGQPDKAMAQHGFARNSMWTLAETKDTAEASVGKFTLMDSDATRAQWNFKFALTFEVVLSAASLTMTLSAQNTDDKTFQFQSLLHTYFAIPDISEVAVGGLNGRYYNCKVTNETKQETDSEIVLPEFTDRVYLGGKFPIAKDVVIGKKDGGGLFAVTNEARRGGETFPCDVVVWNPYEGKSPGDLPPPAFKSFVCVEPGLVAREFDLEPGAIAEVKQKIIPVQLKRKASS
eukprot:gnl/MRDRNA2_/MRDRNA2_29624_c0_seq2.p1 gnl/MRDRNA2_/MRDRNA2_29624_c0~~gnl/MRDRNA2_/MRDRNA2_29624_c0_seq2.p1  ORF type:complete len:300 (+),score=32.03 gnl/MRDRNA2_/MRDRNA2_29624_c0_seq2:110-1009(+)